MDSQLSGEQVLETFHRDVPFLFLGAAFMTTGIVAIGLCALRRRWIALLVWMGVFALLYGWRLWLLSGMARLSPHSSVFFDRIPATINFLVPIPAFIFFRLAGFLGKSEKVSFTMRAILAIFLAMSAGTLIFGQLAIYSDIDTVVVSVFLWIMLVRSIRNREGDRDFKVVRAGVLCFLIFALYDNTIGHADRVRVEPYGFAFLLATLGYVAARRTLKRDGELGEIQKELDVARKIQLSILPGAFPASTDFGVAARYVPVSSVAGDLYDFVMAGERQAGLFIADVSGHGIPAALIASMVKMAATSQRVNGEHPAELLAGMNAALCGNTQGQFVTAAYAHLNAETGELRYGAAGHPALLLLRNGEVTEVAENGLLLAATDAATYSERTVPLLAGDRLMLYTDGLVEARDREGRLFGEDALAAALRNSGGHTLDEAADGMIAAVQKWSQSQEDDLTLLLCDYRSGENTTG